MVRAAGIGGGSCAVTGAGLAEAILLITPAQFRLRAGDHLPCLAAAGSDARGTNRHPVVYCLADRGELPERPALRPTVVEEAVRSGVLPPFIVVYVGTGADSGYQDLPSGGSPAATFLTKEVMPFVDRTWRTTGDRGGRAVVGVGIGGWGAIRLAVASPELVSAAVSIDGEFRTIAEVADDPTLREWVRGVWGGDGADSGSRSQRRWCDGGRRRCGTGWDCCYWPAEPGNIPRRS